MVFLLKGKVNLKVFVVSSDMQHKTFMRLVHTKAIYMNNVFALLHIWNDGLFYYV